jgi:hypothetical protein
MSVQVDTSSSFSVTAPVPLGRVDELELSKAPMFTADGRLLAILQGEGGETTRIDLVLNWSAELAAKVPVAGK